MEKDDTPKVCCFELYDNSKKSMVKCGEEAQWKVGKFYLCNDHFDVSRIKNSDPEKVKGKV